MAIFDTVDYPEVRRVLFNGLDSAALPDPTIGSEMHKGEAEKEVIERLGAFESLSLENKAHAKKAAILLTAAIIAPTITFLIGTSSDGSVTRIPVSYAERSEKANSLRERADMEIAEVNGDAVRLDEPYRPSLPGTMVVQGKLGW